MEDLEELKRRELEESKDELKLIIVIIKVILYISLGSFIIILGSYFFKGFLGGF